MTAAVHIVGWLLVALAAYFALVMHRADRRMQAYRAPGARPGAFALVPLRWKYELYTVEGQELVAKARRSMFLMYGAALLGMLLLS
jgi:hypothetical protein